MTHIILGKLSKDIADQLAGPPDDQAKKKAHDLEQDITALLARQEINASLTAIYWTLGAYDVVIIFDASTAEHAAAAALAIGTQLSISTATLTAFDTTALQRIMDASGYGAHGHGGP